MARTSPENQVKKVLGGIFDIKVENYYSTEPCIYFLFKGRKIVYIGQSLNIHTRIYVHRSDKDKDFDHAKFIRVPEDKMDEIENKMIEHFNPEQNNKSGNDPKIEKLTRVVKSKGKPVVIEIEEEGPLFFNPKEVEELESDELDNSHQVVRERLLHKTAMKISKLFYSYHSQDK